MKKIYLLLGLISNLVFAQQEFNALKIKSWSPILHLQRDTNTGGFTQGIQTQLLDGTNNWFFGALGTQSWIVSKGNHDDAKFLINENGHVGIGTSNPTEKLQILNGNILVGNDNLQGGALFFGNPNHGFKRDYNTVTMFTAGHTESALTFNGASGEQMRIDYQGHVGIGTSTPSEKLEIRGNLKVNSQGVHTAIHLGNEHNDAIITDGTSEKHYGGGYFFRVHNNHIPLNYIDALMIADNGNIGVGVHNPEEKLSVEKGISINGNVDEGGYLSLINNKKTGNSATTWRIYNMTGGYGNSLQFWNYTNDWNGGSRLILSDDGNMSLNGKLEAKEIKVTESPTADFVFEEDYKLPTLKEVEQHIKENKHLPEIASAKQMEKDGVNIGEFQIQLLQKIEELTLYIIEQNKETNKLNNTVLEQQKQINSLNQKIEKISNEK